MCLEGETVRMDVEARVGRVAWKDWICRQFPPRRLLRVLLPLSRTLLTSFSFTNFMVSSAFCM